MKFGKGTQSDEITQAYEKKTFLTNTSKSYLLLDAETVSGISCF